MRFLGVFFVLCALLALAAAQVDPASSSQEEICGGTTNEPCPSYEPYCCRYAFSDQCICQREQCQQPC
ncbi:hypothetical protein FJT64_022784 [Amphibalanus amphitrite]|uniref:Uncharacterized protein n=1 Tax=Amphibalanus amphitrite TaxID=1232801 RepID=A0A6A4WU32_AMPAM|nr:hypothetical protein FJT64_022784 [Amphibalanus amphitrite]